MIMCVLLCYPVSIHMSQLLSTGRPISSSTINFTISDYSAFLELLLLQIRGETIKYASKLKRQSCEKEQNLKNEIENMEKNLEQTDQYNLDAKKRSLRIFVMKKSRVL